MGKSLQKSSLSPATNEQLQKYAQLLLQLERIRAESNTLITLIGSVVLAPLFIEVLFVRSWSPFKTIFEHVCQDFLARFSTSLNQMLSQVPQIDSEGHGLGFIKTDVELYQKRRVAYTVEGVCDLLKSIENHEAIRNSFGYNAQMLEALSPNKHLFVRQCNCLKPPDTFRRPVGL